MFNFNKERFTERAANFPRRNRGLLGRAALAPVLALSASLLASSVFAQGVQFSEGPGCVKGESVWAVWNDDTGVLKEVKANFGKSAECEPILPISTLDLSKKEEVDTASETVIIPSATFETLIKTPKGGMGDYIRDYTLLTDTRILLPRINSGFGFRFSLETQETSGESRPFFQVVIPSWSDSLNSHLAYRTVGGQSTESLPPNTNAHLAVVSHPGNPNNCQLDLYINGRYIGSEQRYNPDSHCDIPIRIADDLRVGQPPDNLGGISGYPFDGKVRSFRISNGVRYADNFSPPNRLDVDETTLVAASLED